VSDGRDLTQRLETLSPKQRRLIELRLDRERRLALERQAVAPGNEPIPAQPRDGRAFPLSFAQQRLWFLDQLEPGSPWYNMPIPLRLTGRLDVAALAAALVEVERRHETLRTTFSLALAGDGEEEAAVQVVGPPSGLPLPLVDLQGLPPAAREAELPRLVRIEARRPFDLAHGPLLRVLLYRTGVDEHALILNMHHIVCDGWSLGVLVRELATLYEAFSRRQPLPASPLPPLPVQYSDFAVWQRRRISGPVLDGLLAYWRRQLAGMPPLLELPADRPRPAIQTFRGSVLPVTLPAGTTAAVRELSRRAGVTPFMTLLAAFLTLLHRTTRQENLVVGSPVANRSRAEIEGLIGFFVNTLVLRTDLGGDPSFRDLLARVRAMAAGAYAHQDLPFEMLVQEIDPERQLAHNPLFQVMFLLQNAPMPELSVAGLKLAPLAARGGSSKFDLSLHFWEAEPELIGYFEYNTDLFDPPTVARMADHFVRLLAGALADPERRVPALPLLSPAERWQVLCEWNDSAADYPRDACLHHLFAAQAARTPDAVAVMDWRGGERLTYAELEGRAGRLARRLRELGVGPDVPVAVCLRRSPALAVAVLAVLAAGGAYVPVDPSYPRERLERMLAIARPRVLLTETGLRDAIPAGDFDVICLDDEPAGVATGLPLAAEGVVSPDNLAYVIFTSGSTGVPKGVAMPHRPLVNLVVWQLRNSALGPGARTLQFASLSFDVSCQELFATWAAGGTLVLISEELRLDASALLDALRAAAVERLFPPFVALQQLAEVAAERDAWPAALREVVTAGEQLQITAAVAELFTRVPECRLFNQYGPSETHVATAYALPGPARSWPALPSVGTAVANTRILLLDAVFGLVPAGVAGELCIGGDCLARGYLSRPDLTAERFVPDPFADGERLYRTGDLARWRPDGNLEFLGRTDQQLKIRGFRVEPGEIESVLAAHPRVREAAVVARQDPGSPACRLVAYLVVPGGDVSAAELRSAVRERLPEYMVPSAFHFLGALPLTPSGKVDRRALPELETAGEEGGSVPPCTPLEADIAEIWGQVLGMERVGVTDSFFDLGGHSLLAVRLLARIHRRLGCDLPLASLFAGPTIGQQAALIERREAPAAATPLVPLRTAGTRRPLFLVHPVGGSVFCYTDLVRALGPDQPVYGLQAPEEGPAPATLEEMAAGYLDALRAVQPQGPYRLGGWSLGGIVAFEMARQLAARGEEVEQLAVLDVSPTGGADAAGDATVLAWFARDLAGLAGRSLPASLGDIPAGAPLAEAFARAQALGVFPLDLDFATAARRFEVFRHNLQLIERYTAHPYPGRIQLFRAADSHFDDPADSTLGWAALAAGGIWLQELPGNHWAIVRSPAVEIVAAALQIEAALGYTGNRGSWARIRPQELP
jgi:amino acid adenylation domain-containing protein